MTKKILSIFEFIKIEHTLFSLPLIYSGLFLAADSIPNVKLLLLVLTGATGARTAALALNRIIDREIDRRNPRTTDRALPSGKMTLKDALLVLSVSLALYVGAAAAISTFCLILSPVPLIIFTMYPYMKRFTPLAHFGVGLGLSMGPLGGWFAVKGSFDGILPGLMLTLFTLVWVTGFDIIYSTLDEAFDVKENLYSFSSRFGKVAALKISAMLHVIAFCILILIYLFFIETFFNIPLLLLSGYLLFLEHRKATDVELAFFKINAMLGFVVFGMVLVGVIL
jgi:4-hydroxybenzoate polyprenyltransferase